MAASYIESFLSSFYTSAESDPWLRPFACLGVTSCNADTFASFSQDVSLDLEVLSVQEPSVLSRSVSANFGISLCEIFRGTLSELMKANGNYDITNNLKLVTECLENFVKNCEADTDGSHLNCLKSLNKSVSGNLGDSLENRKKRETEIQTILAVHMFSPLLAEGEVILDGTCYSDGCKAECRFCKKELKTGNTNYGCKELWHGRADIVIKCKDARKVVMVDFEDDDQGQGETPSKKSKLTEDPADVCNTFVEVQSPIAKSLEILSSVSDRQILQFDKSFRQALSQTIVNAFLVSKENNKLENHFIPSFVVTDEHIYINFYNVKKDILLVQDRPFEIFKGNGINLCTVFSVWLALNFEKFPSGFSVVNNDYYEQSLANSGFQNLLSKSGVLDKYLKEVECEFISIKKPKGKELSLYVNPNRTIKLLHDVKNEAVHLV